MCYPWAKICIVGIIFFILGEWCFRSCTGRPEQPLGWRGEAGGPTIQEHLLTDQIISAIVREFFCWFTRSSFWKRKAISLQEQQSNLRYSNLTSTVIIVGCTMYISTSTVCFDSAIYHKFNWFVTHHLTMPMIVKLSISLKSAFYLFSQFLLIINTQRVM